MKTFANRTITATLMLVLFLFTNQSHGFDLNNNSENVYPYLLNLSIEELMDLPVKSSGIFPIEWDKAPGIYYVVDKKQIDAYGYKSIGEYLNKNVPGMHLATHGNQGMTIGVRGILIDTNSKTILLRDNINTNSRTLVGISGSKLSTPLIGDIERVEVSLGPGTVRHGSGAINGFINLISSTGKSKEGLHLNTHYGSGDSKLFEASFGHVVSDKLNYFFYGGYSQSNGVDIHYVLPKDQWSQFSGVTGTPSDVFLDNAKIGKTDDDYRFSFRAQVGKENDLFQMDLKAHYSRTTNVDPALGHYLDPNSSWTEEIRLAAETRGAGRYSPFFQQYDEEFLVSPELIVNYNSDNTSRIIPYYIHQRSGNEFSDELRDWVSSLNLSISAKNDCALYNCAEDYPAYGWETHYGLALLNNYRGLENQNIGFGTEYRHSQFHYFPTDWDTLSVFAEDLYTTGKFSFLLGVRYDKIFYERTWITLGPAPDWDTGPYNGPPDEEALTKRLAASYSLSPKQAIKLSYQEGFRFADKHPQHWLPHQAIDKGLPNTPMDPEESVSYEVNYAAKGLLENKLNFTTTLFYNIYKNTHGFIAADTNFGNSPKDIKSYGAEFSLDYQITKALAFSLSYSFSKPEDSYETDIKVANNDDTWTRYPEHIFKFSTGYALTDQIVIGSTAILESPRYDKTNTSPVVADLFNVWNFVADLVVSYQYNKSTKVTFSAKELIHKNYHQSTAYFQGERPLDSPRAEDPQYYLTLSYSY